MLKQYDIVFITKYALSKGIIETSCISDENENGRVAVAEYGRFTYLRVGRDLFSDRSLALSKAEKMKTAKIASMERQMRKLQAMTF